MTEAALQTKIDNADSNTSMSELLNMLHSAKEYSYHSLYDSAGVLPAADSANIGRLAFAEKNDGMYVFVGLDSGWQLIDSDAATALAPTIGYYQGSNYGYTASGLPGYKTDITKYSYSTDGNSTDVGDLTVARSDARGLSSTTHGYASGGLGTPGSQNVIDKWTFPSDANATDVGNLTLARNQHASASSETHGYSASGTYDTSPYFTNVIDKVSFSSDGNATDVGDAETSVTNTSGNQSTTNGYIVGGSTGPGSGNKTNKIQKYPFAADANATDAADLTAAKDAHGTNSSSTHGYAFGGRIGNPSTDTNVIEKFATASDANATDVADLDAAGCSSSV